MDDTAGEHLLHLCHLFSSDGRVLAAVWLAKRWPLGLDCVLQQRSAAQVVLSLTDYITKLLEEGFQLLLLRWRQMLGDRWLAGLLGGGGRWRRVSEATISRVPTACPVCRQRGSSR